MSVSKSSLHLMISTRVGNTSKALWVTPLHLLRRILVLLREYRKCIDVLSWVKLNICSIRSKIVRLKLDIYLISCKGISIGRTKNLWIMHCPHWKDLIYYNLNININILMRNYSMLLKELLILHIGCHRLSYFLIKCSKISILKRN